MLSESAGTWELWPEGLKGPTSKSFHCFVAVGKYQCTKVLLNCPNQGGGGSDNSGNAHI